MGEYINLDEMTNTTMLYQLQLNNNELDVKHVGHANTTPDVVLMESSRGVLYSCLYTREELDNNNLFSLIKLVNDYMTFCISIKYHDNTFDVYFTYNIKNSDVIHYKLLEKCVNKNNMIETLLTNITELSILNDV